MKSLFSLNPMIWRYRWRLLLGAMFIVLTNVFAVWAPSMIGEGVNALSDANRNFLEPLSEGIPMDALSSREMAVPENLKRLASWFGADELTSTKPQTRQDVLDIVVWVGLMQAALFLLAYLIKGVFSFFDTTDHHCHESTCRVRPQRQRL